MKSREGEEFSYCCSQHSRTLLQSPNHKFPSCRHINTNTIKNCPQKTKVGSQQRIKKHIFSEFESKIETNFILPTIYIGHWHICQLSMTKKSISNNIIAFASTRARILVYFNIRTYFFYFTLFPKHPTLDYLFYTIFH